LFEKFKDLLAGASGQVAHDKKADTTLRIQIATAVILLEVAYADEELSQSEQARIEEILRKRFQIDQESIGELLQIAEEKRRGSIDIWHFTKIINENFSDEEKYRIIETVWQVIYADGRLDKYEDYIVHKLSNMLHIPHSRMIEAKLKFLPDT